MIDRWFISAVADNRYLYWITEIGSHFMRMNLEDGKAEYMYPAVSGVIDACSAALCIYEGNVFYVINRGEKLAIYNLRENKIKLIHMGLERLYLNMYCYAGVQKDNLIIIPTHGNCTVYVNINTELVQTYSIAESIKSNSIMQYFSLNANVVDGNVNLVSVTTNQYIAYSIREKKIIVKKNLPKKSGKVINYIPFNNGIIMINSDNRIMFWDFTNCRILCDLNEKEGKYMALHESNGIVWIMPTYGKDIYQYTIDTGKLKRFQNYPEEYKYTAPENMGKYWRECTERKKSYFAMHSGTMIFCIDNDKSRGEFIEVKWPEVRQDIEELKYKKETLSERDITLKQYIQNIIY